MSIEIPFQPGARIVAYLRDSGGDDQDLSVPQQKQQISQWVADHNLLLTHVFADVATPGSSTIGRNAFKEMINHFHDPQCKTLMTPNISRLTCAGGVSLFIRSMTIFPIPSMAESTKH